MDPATLDLSLQESHSRPAFLLIRTSLIPHIAFREITAAKQQHQRKLEARALYQPVTTTTENTETPGSTHRLKQASALANSTAARGAESTTARGADCIAGAAALSLVCWRNSAVHGL